MQRIYRRFERGRSSAPRPFADSEGIAGIRCGNRSGTRGLPHCHHLRLQFGKLKRMTGGRSAQAQAASRREFLELVTPLVTSSGPGLTECVIELEGPRGKMRIEWKSAAAPDLAGSSRGVWESA
jgi:hypothetical protein